MKEQIRTFLKFLEDVIREVHPKTGKVVWPTLKAIRVSTIVVVVSSVILAVYIAICDWILQRIMSQIL